MLPLQIMSGYISDENDWHTYESDQEGDYFSVPVKDLFSDKVFASPSEFIEYTVATYKFDIRELFNSLKLDTYGRVRLVNFLRKNVPATSEPTALYTLAVDSANDWKSDDELLLPVDAEDGLLQYAATLRQGYGGASDLEWSDDEDVQLKPAAAVSNEELQARENMRLRTRMEELEEIVQRMTVSMHAMTIDAPSTTALSPATPEDTPAAELKDVPAEPKPTDDVRSNDKAYFGGYSDREIHEVMLRDRHRTESYRQAIFNRAEDLFKGKVVLDVGCGTGILSMFAARAGARRVVAVDAANIIDKAREIVRVNKLDHIISLVKGKVEEISLPADVTTVDVIISEWMGYFLLYESMLPSVFFARDKWMRRNDGVSFFEKCIAEGREFDAKAMPSAREQPFAKDALMFPDIARMFVSGVHTRGMRKESQDFWKDVYGFDMSCLITTADAMPSIYVESLADGDKCTLTTKEGLVAFDLMRADSGDLEFHASLRMTATETDVTDAFVVWFDTLFSSAEHRDKVEKGEVDALTHYDNVAAPSVTLDTSYCRAPTHWRQTVLRLARVMSVVKGDVITLDMVATRSKHNHRHYDVKITYELESSVVPEGESPIMNTNWAQPGVKYTQEYDMA
jgi:protein arginine N-methyltransferase 3